MPQTEDAKQVAQVNGANFDSRLKELFSDDPRALDFVSAHLQAQDRYSSSWWEGLYKWLDQCDFHSQKYDVAEITFRSLASFPADMKLPRMVGFWADWVYQSPKNMELQMRITSTLEDSAIPSTLRTQIPAFLAEHPRGETLDTILQGYRLFGEDVGQEMRANIISLFISGLAVEDVFNANLDALVQLYSAGAMQAESEKVVAKEAVSDKKPSFLSGLVRYVIGYVKGHRVTQQEYEPANPKTILEDRLIQAKKRVEVIRDIVRELFPAHEEYYRYSQDHSSIEGADGTTLGRLMEHEQEIGNIYCNKRGVSRDASTLPVETLERYLADIHQLKTLPGYEELERGIMNGNNQRGIVAPYTALGSSWNIPLPEVLSHLRELKNSGRLEDRIISEVLTGMGGDSSNLGENPQAQQNIRVLIDYQVPEGVHRRGVLPLLTLQEDALRQGLETVRTIQTRDAETAAMVLYTLPKLHSVFGDKYSVVLSYFEKERKREYLRAIGQIRNDTYVVEAVKGLELTDSGKRQGERLIRFARDLDAFTELNQKLELGMNVEVTPDLKTSYENVQSALKGALSRLGVSSSDEVYRFMPWIMTRDETALKVLRGEQVQKVGESRSYNLQADVKVDLEGMRRDVETYAKSIGLELPDVHVGDLNTLQEMARYVMSEVTRRKDIPQDVLGEVKPNLARILTTIDASGSYTLSINPQDLKGQMEALQNVTSCLAPGGSMFKYTQGYLENPYTSWATIRGKQGIVGRVTLFYGQDETGHPAIARVSKVYSQVPISETEIDSILNTYATETGARVVKNGKLTVPGLKMAYDDLIGGLQGSTVTVR